MTSRKFLITRPNHDTTVTYLFQWSEEILRFCNKNNISFSVFQGEDANKKNVENYLEKQMPKFVMFNGHGDARTIYGHDDEPLVTSGKNEDVLESKIVYSVSCESAAELGETS
jgi:hypothetical protein